MPLRNPFTQNETLVFATTEALVELSEKEHSELLVISDSHGRSDILCSIVEEKGKDCDALFFCGDGIRDIATLVERACSSSRFSACVPPVLAFVQGNNDYENCPMVNPKHLSDPEAPCYMEVKIPQQIQINVSGMNVFMAHGHHHGVYGSIAPLCLDAANRGAKTVLFGHTHIAMKGVSNEVYAINPGSCAFPRGGQPPCFARVGITKGKDFPSCRFFRLSSEGSIPYEMIASPW